MGELPSGVVKKIALDAVSFAKAASFGKVYSPYGEIFLVDLPGAIQAARRAGATYPELRSATQKGINGSIQPYMQ